MNNTSLADLARTKGWTLSALSKRWSMTERNLSRKASDIAKRVPDSDSELEELPLTYLDAVKGLPLRVELKTTTHPSGRKTLMQRMPGETMFSDCIKENIVGVLEEHTFWDRVFKLKEKLEGQGYVVALKKANWLLIPRKNIEAHLVDHMEIYAWMDRWIKNTEEDKKLQENCEEAIAKAMEDLGLVFNEKDYGQPNFDNLKFLFGSDGIAVSEHFFSLVPDEIKRITQ
ncbi:hypothetical protein AB6F25_21835 [Vibrio splendidus]